MDDKKKEAIKKELKGIAEKKFKTLQKINVGKIDLNPYLLRLLSLNTAQEIAEFIVSQRIERSVVTSYGSRIQTIARILADEGGTGVEGADICKVREGKRHYIQIKSGPNTPNKDITKMINSLMAGATRRNHGSIALLGITYSTRENVSNIIRQYSQIDWLIGREFWTFIGDNPATAHEIFNIIKEVSDTPKTEGSETYSSLLGRKVGEIASQLRERYGDSGDEMWEKMFEDNM